MIFRPGVGDRALRDGSTILVVLSIDEEMKRPALKVRV